MTDKIRLKTTFFLILISSFFFMISLAGWKVSFLEISSKKSGTIISTPCPDGQKINTRYIHSVELTPVEDYYIITGDKMWSWEEKVRSSKAGMPQEVPVNGRFIDTGEWLIYQGGRIFWDIYFYRIGDKNLGLNQADIHPYGLKDFYKIFTGERLVVEIKHKPFLYSKPFLSDKFREAPSGVKKINEPVNKYIY